MLFQIYTSRLSSTRSPEAVSSESRAFSRSRYECLGDQRKASWPSEGTFSNTFEKAIRTGLAVIHSRPSLLLWVKSVGIFVWERSRGRHRRGPYSKRTLPFNFCHRHPRILLQQFRELGLIISNNDKEQHSRADAAVLGERSLQERDSWRPAVHIPCKREVVQVPPRGVHTSCSIN